MGNKPSVQKQLTNDEIIANISKLFKSEPDDIPPMYTVETLNLNNPATGGDVKSTRNRYAPIQQQLGGQLKNIEKPSEVIKIEKFINQMVGGDKQLDEELEELDFEDEKPQTGGADCDATSAMFMSEIRKMNNLSATSYDEPPKMNGGCCAPAQYGGDKKCLDSACERTSNLTSLSGLDLSHMVGGCPCNTSISNTIGLAGGSAEKNKPSSENINIMPFFSSTSGTEYYNNIQREHRYT